MLKKFIVHFLGIFFIFFSRNCFPVVWTPADLWYLSWFPRYRHPDFLWRMDGGIAYSSSRISAFQKDKYVRIQNMKYVRIWNGRKNLCGGEICPFVSLSSCLYIGFHASIFHFDNTQEVKRNIWHKNKTWLFLTCATETPNIYWLSWNHWWHFFGKMLILL